MVKVFVFCSSAGQMQFTVSTLAENFQTWCKTIFILKLKC